VEQEAAEELIHISREAKIPAEFYHVKAAGKSNWNKLDQLLGKIEAARAQIYERSISVPSERSSDEAESWTTPLR